MSKIIIDNNKYSHLEETDLNFIQKLDSHLSFKVQGAEYTAAYRGFFKDGKFIKWDGIRRILTPKLSFPNGLIDRIKSFYKNNDKEIEVLDKRKERSASKEINIEENLKKINKTPFEYQLNAVEEALKHERGIIRMCTGSGKTFTAALLTAKLGKKTIVMVIGNDLLYQFHKEFSAIFDEKIGILGDGNFDIQNITIASIWTLAQALNLKKEDIILDDDHDYSKESISIANKNKILSYLKEVKVIMLDECHVTTCNTIQEIYKIINPENVYGFSGTPFRDDGSDLLIEAILGKQIINISASTLIEKGFLAKPFIRFLNVPKYEYKLPKNYQSVYSHYIVENEERNNLVLKSAKRMIEQGFQVLVLFNTIKHGDILYELFSKEMKCELLSGNDNSDRRLYVKEQLLSNKIQCVLASKIFDIGVDIPSLSGLVIACGGKSSIRALQRIGRVIRKYPAKKFAAVVDFVDNEKYLKDHSEKRFRVYSSEDGFDVKWSGLK